jgi:hypothetical protein|uniref:Uncharacterized protein n=1 Tax=Podoviridae sp. ct8Lf7 TaxID=2827723 RepID=A0A8S5S1I2_9CAUD|nr:MAG TPA: hypothetical protein [Podoviridae sp. ct8Lf7]
MKRIINVVKNAAKWYCYRSAKTGALTPTGIVPQL